MSLSDCWFFIIKNVLALVLFILRRSIKEKLESGEMVPDEIVEKLLDKELEGKNNYQVKYHSGKTCGKDGQGYASPEEAFSF